jgi:ADP-glucose pyrophosphorylase
MHLVGHFVCIYVVYILTISRYRNDTECMLLQCDHIVRIDTTQVLQLLKNPDFDVLSACLPLTFNLLRSKLIHPVIRLSERGQDIISSDFLQTLFIKFQSLSIQVLIFVNEEIMCKYIRAEASLMTK